ncbi:MAG: YhbY family RNA-binding protein [Calditrichia bacterium]
MSLTGKEKRELRALGNRLKAEVHLGKEGVSEGTIRTIENSFNTKELIKIKLLETCPVDRDEAAGLLSEKTGAEIVQVLGNTILLYRQLSEDEE